MERKIIASSCNILFGGSRGNFYDLMKKIANTNFDILFIQESYGNIHKIVQTLQNQNPTIKLSYNPKTNIIVKGDIISFNDNFDFCKLKNNQILLLGNCHLPSDYSDYNKINDFDYEFKHRLIYLKSIMKIISKYSKYYPTILAGDFNTIQSHVEFIGSKYGFVDKTNDIKPTWNINLNLHQDQVDNFTSPLKIDFILHNKFLKHIDYNVVPLIESDHALITKTFNIKININQTGSTIDRYAPYYLTKPVEFYDETKESNFEIKFLSTDKFKIKYINCPGNRYDWITFYNKNNELVGYIYTKGSVNKIIKYSNSKSIKSEYDQRVYFPKFIANESYISQYMIDDGYTPFDKIQSKKYTVN